MTNLPDNLKLIGSALVFLGGEADLSDIYKKVAELLPTWAEFYKDEATFKGTIRHTIESYCPQSENWDAAREAMFEKIARGRYRIIFPEDRPRVVAKGRSFT